MGRKSNDQKLSEFFDKNREYLVKAPGEINDEDDNISCYLWENYDEVKRKLNEISSERPGAYCYTLVEEDGKAYIIPRWHIVNRYGYFISTKEVEDSDLCIRYW